MAKQILETPRLILRKFVAEDADALALVISDAKTMRYYPAPMDRQGVEDWIARNQRRYAANGHGLWAMILKSTTELIGDCGITVQGVDGVDEREIGYHLRRDCWGQGFATEAAQACRNYGFRALPVSRMVSIIRPDNLPSRRVAERNGMTLWKEAMHKDLPHVVYAIQRSEFEKLIGSANSMSAK